MGIFPGDGYQRNLLIYLMQSTLNGYTKRLTLLLEAAKLRTFFHLTKFFFTHLLSQGTFYQSAEQSRALSVVGGGHQISVTSLG